MKDWFKSLSPGMQTLVGIVMIVIAWYFLKYIKTFLMTYGNKVTQGSEVDALQAAGVQASYQNSQYGVMAQKLVTAISGWGTDEDAIFGVFNMLNNDIDFIKLDQAFGLREQETMSQWIAGDLSTAQIGTLNTGMLQKGLTKQLI
jgi:hypothetical protein